ncbi:MAG: CO dehydrogenase/CO-methylating acetyl-CoA synthase complex subunit beta [Methanomicrobiales archaeon]|nr:CO dehydrogenase/CO-methylating acetyl-CoA synthase complex subunit beta [Methanomicrobiales archaeon]
MFEDIPVDVGIVHEGERIRRKDMYVELGGPDIPEKFELVRVRKPGEVENGSIRINGPDLAGMKEGGAYPIGILVEVAGAALEEDLEGVFERRIHEYCNYIEGFMHLNQRYDIWLRLSRKSYQKGFDSFTHLGRVLQKLFLSELSIIEKIQITFFSDPARVAELAAEARRIYDARDTRARGLSDEDVDTFYGCALCQSFAPSHICIITPQRFPNCGAISWFDGRAAARIDPKGSIYPIEKGEYLDPLRGEYTGVNEAAKKASLGDVNRIWLYSGFGHPHTSCGCFEGIAFYIPEVEGFGIVHRGYKEVTVNGLPFTTMAESTAGGRQVDGFHGISIEYMRSPKFLQADGGYQRVVWMPKEVKDRVKDFIPKELVDRIATEEDARTIDDLKAFLKEKGHPIVERFTEAEAVQAAASADATLVLTSGTLPLTAGAVRIILKNARIYAEKVIIQPLEPGRPGKGG